MEARKTPTMELPLDQGLLEQASEVRDQWRLLRERLKKIEENKSQVPPVVHERVQSDYQNRLARLRDQLIEKKTAVDREIEQLRLSHQKISTQLEEQRHHLDEMKFRQTLGEFTEMEFQERAQASQEKIGKFETILSAITANMGRYESIFAGDDFEGIESETLDASDEGKEAESPKAIFGTGNARAEEPLTDESGYIIEEEGPNYFASTQEREPETSDTVKARILEQTAAGEPAVSATLIAISGPQVGKTYSLKEVSSLGRAESNHIVIRDPKVSRQHSQIQRKGKEFVIVDLNSSNGTLVNGERIDEHVLANGDEIQIGDAVLQFKL